MQNFVYVVIWSAGLDNAGDGLSTNCGCTGVFTDRKKAEEVMLKERDQAIDDMYESYEEVDPGEEMEDWVANRTNHQIYGRPEEGRIEIDWGTNCKGNPVDRRLA